MKVKAQNVLIFHLSKFSHPNNFQNSCEAKLNYFCVWSVVASRAFWFRCARNSDGGDREDAGGHLAAPAAEDGGRRAVSGWRRLLLLITQLASPRRRGRRLEALGARLLGLVVLARHHFVLLPALARSLHMLLALLFVPIPSKLQKIQQFRIKKP